MLLSSRGVFLDSIFVYAFKVITISLLFLVLCLLGKFILKRYRNHNNRFFKLEEYFPEEEIHTLKQVFYLIMMMLFFIDILYSLVFFNSQDILFFLILDIVISLYVVIVLEYDSWKNRLIFIMLIPFGSFTSILFGDVNIGAIELINIPVFIYLMKVYYSKFKEYTENNGLGIAIVLLYSIIFISFIVTTVAENVDPLNALVMVSNAFTSNGYAVLGKSTIGKVDSIFLVWGGYILSGVATSTLTASILIKHFRKDIKRSKKQYEDLQKRFDDLEMLIKEKD